MEFEWDEQKRTSNLRKHDVDFADVTSMFRGYILEYYDDRYNYGEERFIAIGQTDGKMFFVVYTVRDNVIRLISARRANKNERRDYYESNS